MKTTEEIFEILTNAFPDGGLELESADLGQPWIVCPARGLKEIAKFLRDDENTRFDTLMCLSGMHYPEAEMLGAVYHLHSTTLGHTLVLKVNVPVDSPDIESIEQIWKTAGWHEREAYDMVGVNFTGHPDLRRILCPDDWEGFPLRKDYIQQDSYMGITTKYVEEQEKTDD